MVCLILEGFTIEERIPWDQNEDDSTPDLFGQVQHLIIHLFGPHNAESQQQTGHLSLDDQTAKPIRMRCLRCLIDKGQSTELLSPVRKEDPEAAIGLLAGLNEFIANDQL
jgi:hypothetical protein